MSGVLLLAGSLLSGTVFCAEDGAAAGEPAKKWSHSSELSLVSTSGNAETSTFGLRHESIRSWTKGELSLKVGGIRTETTSITRFAVGTEENYVGFEIKDKEVSVETYYLKGRYNRKITERLFWYAALGWDRNIPAGIENRYMVDGGVGNIWADGERFKFSTDYALTYTDRTETYEDPRAPSQFVGALVGLDLMKKFGKVGQYDLGLDLGANLEETSDWDGVWTNAISVTMTKKLGLKIGLDFHYRNKPALDLVPLIGIPDPEEPVIAIVPLERESLDTYFTTALVVNF